MRILALLLPITLAVAALACEEPEKKQGLQIDPVSSPSAEKDNEKAKDDKTDVREAADQAAAPAADIRGDAGTEHVNDCASAVDLGQMAGEPKSIGEPAETVTGEGRCSKWFKVRVNETSSLRIPLAITASLTSPSSTKFDLYAYLDKEKDESACGMEPTASSATTLSNVDQIDLKWGDDGWWWSSQDDSRTVIFEVRSASGACDASSSWSLVVHTTTSTN